MFSTLGYEQSVYSMLRLGFSVKPELESSIKKLSIALPTSFFLIQLGGIHGQHDTN